MASEDRITSTGVDHAIIPTAPPPPELSNTRLRQAADFLADSTRIGVERSHYLKYRRYVTLNSSDIFASLSQLYTQIFATQWQYYARLADVFLPPNDNNKPLSLARAYISCWFWDLYVSNREAVRKISSIAFSERFSQEQVHFLYEYDEFLSLLNAAIRPTHIKYASEDAVYIPVISNTYDWNTFNPFNINNFTVNVDLVLGVMQIIKDRKNWSLAPLSNDAMGRPCWLYDWHESNQVCSWFHPEGNFNLDDVTLAYIVGVACTPKLAPRDIDEWQTFPNGILPAVVNPANYQRGIPPRFYGSYMVRTIEYEASTPQELTAPPTSGAKRARLEGTSTSGGTQTSTEPSTALAETPPQAPVYRYRLTDWCYYARVILNMEFHTRTGAHRIIVLAKMA